MITVFVTGLAMQASAGTAYLVIFETILIAFFFGFVLIGLPALLGSLVLRAERNRAKASPLRSIALISVALAVLNSALVLAMVWFLTTFFPSDVALPSIKDLVVPGIVSSFGWGIGLLVSGFPDILKRAPYATAPAATAPPTAQTSASDPFPASSGRTEPKPSPAHFARGPPGI